jgi:hypothetical protein
MLSQTEADRLLALVKVLAERGPIDFPLPGTMQQLELHSEDGRDEFQIDVNRKGRIKVSKCTYQERYQVVEILLRLDIDGPPHENPDGTEVPCPHLHIYREGYGDKWAHPTPSAAFGNTSDLIQTLIDFLRYCGVRDIPDVQHGIA